MKSANYQLTNGDIEVILFALSVLPLLGLEKSNAQADINQRLCISASEKLINRETDFSSNELRVIFASLNVLQLINQGVYEADPEIKKKCSIYLFSINKLVSVFDPFDK